jgi:hypothetical protein
VNDDASTVRRNGLLLAGGSLAVLALLLVVIDLPDASPWLRWGVRAFVAFPLVGLSCVGLEFAAPAWPSRPLASLHATLRGRCLGCGGVLSSSEPCAVCGAPPMTAVWEARRRYGAAALLGGVTASLCSAALALASVVFSAEFSWVARGTAFVVGAGLAALGYVAARQTRAVWRATREQPGGFDALHPWEHRGHHASTLIRAVSEGGALVIHGETRIGRDAPEVDLAAATPLERALAWALRHAAEQRFLHATHLTLHRWTLRAERDARPTDAHYREGSPTPYTHEALTGVRVGPRAAVDEALTAMGVAPEALGDDGGEVWMPALRDALTASPERAAKCVADEPSPEEFRDEKLRAWLRAVHVRRA